SMVGGELKAYVEMVNQSRAIATKRMVEEAERLGADAIVMVRFTSSTVSAGAAEILVFGTAVKYTS
ncbi:MAG: heavy metal-binding domain-containing protein, partial [Candidatus Methanomethylophilus sp.]|nr:heavy metal-binding domain-containing protein [Methanomethylophilus sp.]